MWLIIERMDVYEISESIERRRKEKGKEGKRRKGQGPCNWPTDPYNKHISAYIKSMSKKTICVNSFVFMIKLAH